MHRTALLLASCLATATAADATWPQVAAIFDDRCISCHGDQKQKAGLRLDSPSWLAKGSHDGPVVVAGKPEESLLYKLVALPADNEDRMPPKGERLTTDQLELLSAWIAAGASTDAATAPMRAPPDASALLKAPAVPESVLSALQEQHIGVTTLEGGWLDVNAAHTANGITEPQLTLLAKAGGAIAFLNLAGSGITDRQLGLLKPLSGLRCLHLERTPITDAGMSALAGLASLSYLNLIDTQVGDKGLATLAPLTGLRELYLWRTKATPAGATNLQDVIPELRVVFGPDDLPNGTMKQQKRKKK